MASALLEQLTGAAGIAMAPTSNGVRERARESERVTGAGKSQVCSFALRAQKNVQKTNDSVGGGGREWRWQMQGAEDSAWLEHWLGYIAGRKGIKGTFC